MSIITSSSGGMGLPVFPGHSTNLVGLPTGLLGSAAFNDHPLALHITGVRGINPSLFTMLGEADGAADAGLAFETYMAAVFGLDPEQRAPANEGPRRYRASYFRLLKGWGYDSNSREGAVLKGWVESRFGLFPTFHKVPLGSYPSPAWMEYVEEKMAPRFHNNSILSQLDLLYEFCQWVLERYSPDGAPCLMLYRGINDFSEHPIIAKLDRKRCVIRLNNLVSFTSDRDVASCFGDRILEVRVPLVKVMFFAGLLPRHGLKGEAEYLVIGGDYLAAAKTM